MKKPSEPTDPRLDKQLEELDLAVELEKDDAELSDVVQVQMARQVLALIDRVRKSKEDHHSRALDRETVGGQAALTDICLEPKSPSTGEIQEDAAHPTELRKIGRFRIKRQLGQGGYGLVFLAEDPQLDRNVALKIPRPEVVMTSSLRARFLREAQAAAALSHPNIVPVFESGGDGPICFIAYEWIEGPTLADCLSNSAESRVTNQKDAAQFVAILAEAVHHAHQRGILHRDLKPANVMLKPKSSGEEKVDLDCLNSSAIPMITDFGLGKFVSSDDSYSPEDQTRTGALIGTPAYMSPEQTQIGKYELDARSDVYSLGAILYELLTGQPPFTGSSVLEVANAVQSTEANPIHGQRPDVSRDLEAICFKCLEKKPHDRYDSAYALKRDLERYLNGETTSARRITTWHRMWRWAQRNPAIAGPVSALFLVIVAALMVSSFLLYRSEYHRHLAENRGVELKNEVAAKDEAIRLATSRSRELKSAFDDLFTSIAMTPEIRIEGTESLRQELLESVNQYYREFSRERPANAEALAQQAGTINRIADLKYYLKDYAGSLATALQAMALIETSDVQTRLVETAKINSYLLQAKSLAALGRDRDFVSTCTKTIELAKSYYQRDQAIAATIELAKTYSQLASAASDHGHRTMANEFSVAAVDLWQTIDQTALDPSTLRSNVEAYFTAGLSLAAAQKSEEAAEWLDLALEWTEQNFLHELDEESPNFISNVAKAYRSRGFTLINDKALAEAYFQKAEVLLNYLRRRHPLVAEYLIQHASLKYSWALADFIPGRYEAAIETLNENLRWIEMQLVRFPDADVDLLRRQADYFALLGYSQKNIHRLDDALVSLNQSKAINERLVELTNQTIVSRLQLHAVVGGVASVEGLLENYASAIGLLKQSNEQLLTILKEDPQNGACSRYLANNFARLSEFHGKLNRWDQALMAFERSIKFENVRPSAYKLGQRAQLHLRLGNWSAARLDYQAFLESVPSSTNPKECVDRATVAVNFLAIIDSIAAETSTKDQAELHELRTYAVESVLQRLVEMRDNPQVDAEHWRQLFPDDSELAQPIKQWREQFMK